MSDEPDLYGVLEVAPHARTAVIDAAFRVRTASTAPSQRNCRQLLYAVPPYSAANA